MKVYELAKKLKKQSKEFLSELDDPRIKSHLSVVPDDILAEYDVEEKKIETEPKPEAGVDTDEAQTLTVDSGETITDDFHILDVSDDGEKCPVDSATIELSIRSLGGKSPYYKWRNLIG